jgi:hypothetical protein
MPKVKQLTVEERKGEDMFALWKELIDNVGVVREKTIRNAEIFTNIYEHQGWKDILGDEDSQWSGLLAQVETHYTRAEVARWMLLWRTLHIEFGFLLEDLFKIPVTRLENIAKYCKDSVEAKHYMDLAESLSPQEWRDEIAKLRGKPTRETCKHDKGFVHYAQCPICSDKKQVEK